MGVGRAEGGADGERVVHGEEGEGGEGEEGLEAERRGVRLVAAAAPSSDRRAIGRGEENSPS